jgi:hypothetical protein
VLVARGDIGQRLNVGTAEDRLDFLIRRILDPFFVEGPIVAPDQRAELEATSRLTARQAA